MSNKTKAIIAAVLALLGSLFGAYVAYSDNDPATQPDVEAVVEDVGDVIDAATTKEKADATTEAGEGEEPMPQPTVK